MASKPDVAMRRCSISIAVFLAVIAAGVIVATPAVISARLSKAEIAERIKAWTGRPVTLRGDLAVSIFPYPSIEAKDVVVSEMHGAKENPPLISIPSLKASLRILPLLRGRLEVGTLTLVNPRVHLVMDAAGKDNWGGGHAHGKATLDAVASRFADLHLGELVLRDGAVVYDDRRTEADAIIAADLDLAWERTTQSVELSGIFASCGEILESGPDVDAPLAALDGMERCGRRLQPAMKAQLSADDDIDTAGLREPAGEADVLNRSLWRLAKWLGIPARPGLPTGPLRIAGKLEIDKMSVKLSEATFRFGGKAAKGTLAFGLGSHRPTLQGSLVLDSLDLTPYAAALLPPNATLAQVLALPVSAKWLPNADIDLGLSADEVLLGNNRVTEAAMALVAREGSATFSLKDASLAGGSMEGEVTVAPAEEGASVRLSARLDDVSVGDAGRFIWAAGTNRLIRADAPLLGRGTARLDLSARGATVGALVESLEGGAVAEIRDGTIVGVDLDSTLEDLSEGNTVIAKGHAPFLPLVGKTHFAAWMAHVTINEGIARAKQVRFEGDRIKAMFSGESDLKRGEIEAEGVVFLSRSESSDAYDGVRPSVELPFGVGGTIWRPVIAPGIPCIGHCWDDATGLPWRTRGDPAGNVQER